MFVFAEDNESVFVDISMVLLMCYVRSCRIGNL